MIALRIFILLILFLKPADGALIPIEGLTRTSSKTVVDFLWPEGEHKEIKLTDVQDLQNLAVFESVVLEGEKKVVVKERWTTIPIVKGQSGGGVEYKALGVFDPNVFGRLLELGAQYENLSGQDSGVVWFRKPRMWGRLNFGGDFWNSRRLRFLYDPQGNIQSGFITKRMRYNLFLENQVLPYLWLGGGLDYRRDAVENQAFAQSFQNSFVQFFDSKYLDFEREKLWFRFFARFGRLNESIPFFEGRSLEIELAATQKGVSSASSLFTANLQWRYFALVGDHNFGVRLRVDGTSSRFPEDLMFVGGLDRVRGFQDGQFYGQRSAVANLEHRFRFFKMKPRWLELQSVVFTDWGQVDTESGVFGSVGVGIRFISPRIYRFNARVDYAQVVQGQGGDGLSIGLQHFF